jgi:hypothetical protein
VRERREHKVGDEENAGKLINRDLGKATFPTVNVHGDEGEKEGGSLCFPDTLNFLTFLKL